MRPIEAFLRAVLFVSSHVLVMSASCINTDLRSVKWSVSTHRNDTGHWIAKAEVDHGVDDQISGENSGQWSLDMELHRIKCGAAESAQLVVSLTAPPPRPGPGYEYYPGIGYYKFHPEARTWAAAKKICAEEGAHLLVLNHEHEVKLVKEMFPRYPGAGGYAFVGFHDQHAEGQYVTMFGEPLSRTGYSKWANGQPDNSGGSATSPGEDCGTVLSNGELNDFACHHTAAFICEQMI